MTEQHNIALRARRNRAILILVVSGHPFASLETLLGSRKGCWAYWCNLEEYMRALLSAADLDCNHLSRTPKVGSYYHHQLAAVVGRAPAMQYPETCTVGDVFGKFNTMKSIAFDVNIVYRSCFARNV